jgi:hypothetical protein
MTFPLQRLQSLATGLRLRVGIVFSVPLLLLPATLVARLMEGATYEQMFDKADLVVIAKPLSSKDTEERTMLPGWEDIHVPASIQRNTTRICYS